MNHARAWSYEYDSSQETKYQVAKLSQLVYYALQMG